MQSAHAAPPKSKIEKLEMMRGFAAVYVCLAHFLFERVWKTPNGASYLFLFGQEAVMLFFLISGFVVYYSTERQGDSSFRGYFVRRARRIYPIFLLALGLAMTVAWFSPDRNMEDYRAGRILGNVFMLQDFQEAKPGVWVSTLAGNSPLWSLSYEWWFYLGFYPLWRFVSGARRVHVAGGVSLVAFGCYLLCPNQASLFGMYFVVWWAGAEMARTYLSGRTPTWRTEWRSLIYVGVLTALACVVAGTAWAKEGPLRLGLYPVLIARHLCAALVILVLGLLWARLKWMGFRTLFGHFSIVAPISYALYVFHVPLSVRGSYLDVVTPEWLRLGLYVTVAVAVSWLAEGPFQRWINRLTAR
jgi:peptidoglycan/LPS O-acetylase OafA/YrhL